MASALAVRTVAMSGCGWLLPFHVGVAHALLRRKLVNDRTHWAGTSAGALVAAAMASGIAPDTIMTMAGEVGRKLRREHSSPSGGGNGGNGGRGGRGDGRGSVRAAWARMAVEVEKALLDVLPEDAHERCAGRLSVAVTPLRHRLDPWLHLRDPVLVSEFHSRADLVGALLCSSHIPFYLDGSYSREWRGAWWVDGGFADIFPEAFTRRRRERARREAEAEAEALLGQELSACGPGDDGGADGGGGGDAAASSKPQAGAVDMVAMADEEVVVDGTGQHFNGTVMSVPYREIAHRMDTGFLIGPGSPLARPGCHTTIAPAEGEFSLRDLVPWSFAPATDEVMWRMFEAGERHTELWYEKALASQQAGPVTG